MTPKTVVERVNVKGFSNAENLLGGPLSIRSGAINIKVNPFEILCLIMKR